MTDILTKLSAIIAARKDARPDSSYVAKLQHSGLDKILEKVGEEAVETILAAKNADRDSRRRREVVNETADLWFHCLVMLGQLDLEPGDVLAELERRFGVSGLDEKASRENT